jgi:hypothetical protein
MCTAPGFTADASLYTTEGHYRSSAARAGGAGLTVVPSFIFPPIGCARRCHCYKPSSYPELPGLIACIEFDCKTHIEGTC